MSKDEYEMKGRVLNRGNSLFALYPQTQLLNAMRQKDMRAFKKLLLSNTVEPDHCYDNPDYKTCLDIACSDPGYSEFVKLLLEQNVDINKINKLHGRAPIHFAVEAGDPDTMRVLLEDPNIKVNAMSKGNTALHLAIKQIINLINKEVGGDRDEIIKKYEEIVELLLKANSDVNIPDMQCLTPIYSAAKQGLERIVQLIVEYSKNLVDLDSYKDGNQNSARTIIQQSFPYLLEGLPPRDEYKETIDVHKLFGHLSSHDEERFIGDFNKIKRNGNLSEILSENNGLYTLLQFACANGMDEAVRILLENGSDPNLSEPEGSPKAVALACSNGYHKVLKLLADNESTSFEPINGDSLLQIVIKEARHKIEGEPKIDYKECLNILLENPNTDVNHLDNKKSTALHYATRSGNQEAVMALLKKGACIGLRNIFNEPPLADMSAKTLESYLDDCLTANSDRPNDDKYEIQFNYRFLVPPSNSPKDEVKKPDEKITDDSGVPNGPKHEVDTPIADDSISLNDCSLAPETDALLMTANSVGPNDENYEIQFNNRCLVPPSNSPKDEVKIPVTDDSGVPNGPKHEVDIPIADDSTKNCSLAPETDALLYMTRCSELKPLLKHPVITSFLYLKWQRISCLFYANCTFYAVFCLSLILFILYGGPTEKSQHILAIAYITRILTIVGLLLLIVREGLQIVLSPKVYLKSIENWLEICLILITATIVFKDSTSEHSKQQLSAIAILLASAEFTLLFGQCPCLLTYLVMLKTVSWNFFKFLMWYCILIIAFSLSFYTLFRTVKKDVSTDECVPFDSNKTAGADDKNINFFLNPFTSLFKTIVMLTGEFEAGSIHFEAFPITSHIIFVIFVFMIPIVLFNLLNGLAVSDTQAIKSNAELVGHISRIILISYFERMILGDTGPVSADAVSRMQKVFLWLRNNYCAKLSLNFIKPLALRVCLFPNFLPMAQIGVKVNQMSRIVVYTTEKKHETDDDNLKMTWYCMAQFNEALMDRKVVKAAKMLIAEREEGRNEMKQINDKLIHYEKKMESFEKLLEQIYISVKN